MSSVLMTLENNDITWVNRVKLHTDGEQDFFWQKLDNKCFGKKTENTFKVSYDPFLHEEDPLLKREIASYIWDTVDINVLL